MEGITKTSPRKESHQVSKHDIVVRPKADREALIQAMWLLFLFAPSKLNPEPDGFYYLGEIGSDAKKNWSRVTPYSPTLREER